MRFAALVLVALALTAVPAFGQKIYIDYDKDYDSSHIKTFAWRATEDSSVAAANPLLHSRILNGIEHYITMNGTLEVESDPDVWVTYHANSREEVVFNTSSYGYGYPGGWHGGYGGYYGRGYYGGGYYGGASSVSTVSTYQRGTLIVEARSLRGITVEAVDVPGLIDELPILMVAAAAASGTTRLLGIGELRVKETDRIRSMVKGLSRRGIV